MEPVVSVLRWPILIAIMCAGAVVSVCMLCWGLWRRCNQSAPPCDQGTQAISIATRSISTCTTVTTDGANGGKKKGEDEGHGLEDSVSPALRKMQKRIEALERRSLRDVASSDTESPRRCHSSPAQTWRRRKKDNDSSRERGDRRG